MPHDYLVMVAIGNCSSLMAMGNNEEKKHSNFMKVETQSLKAKNIVEV